MLKESDKNTLHSWGWGQEHIDKRKKTRYEDSGDHRFGVGRLPQRRRRRGATQQVRQKFLYIILSSVS